MNTVENEFCQNDVVLENYIDTWAMVTFATGRPAPGRLSAHVAQCHDCRRRAANAWSLFSENDDLSLQVPTPDLRFLQLEGLAS